MKRAILSLYATNLFHVSTCLQPPSSSFSTTSSSESSSSSRIVLNVDQSAFLTSGTTTLPPMVSVPCSLLNGSVDVDDDGKPLSTPFLQEIIKPPNVEALYDWYVNVQQKPDADPSWAILWPTAVSLATFLIDHQKKGGPLVNNQKVVELGCGLGLAGLTAACLGAKSVLLTDREAFALHCAMSTAAVHNNNNNKQDLNVRAAILDWNDHASMQTVAADFYQQTDLILASDVLYDATSIEAFAKVCQAMASPGGAHVLVSDPVQERVPGARKMLKEALQKHNHNDKKDVMIEELPMATPEEVTSLVATTMDGKDHERRMQEPTVILSISL